MEKYFTIRNGRANLASTKNFSTCPIGTVLSFAGQTAPRGFLLCDGDSYKVSEYPDLYAVVGNAYGGDTENFNVPNLVDKFIQGSTTSGTEKEAGLPNIEGKWLASSVYAPYFEGTLTGAFSRGEDSQVQSVRRWGSNDGSGANVFSFDASLSNPIYSNSDTVQPPALTMVYIIKAFHTNEGVDSGVSDDVVEYVEGEIAEVESKVDGLISDTSSTTSTYSSAKIDEKYGAYTFGTANATQWLKLTLGNNSKFQPIVISDQYGGKVEIIGMADDGTYKPVKLVRYSYGDWTTYSATDFTTTDQGDANYKIRRLFYYPVGSCYYLEIRQYCTIKVSGVITKPEMVTSLPVATSEMTLIPESQFASKSDLATKQDNLSARKVYVRRNSSANKYVLLATIDMRVLTNLGQPLRIKGVIGNMANDITNIDLTINARNGFVKKILYGTVTHKNFLTNDVNIIITKSDDGKTAYVYLYCISSYAYIDAEIYLGSVHYSVPSTFDLVGTIQGTEYTSLLDSNYVVVENVINDTSTGDTTSTWSSSKIATEIDNAILTKDIIYKGALTANTRKVIATTVGVDLSKIVSISKIFGDTLEGWDYGICQMTNTGELIYMPTATSESSHIQIRIAYRA